MISHNKETFSRNEKFAYQKGYRVTPEGTMYGLRGQVITNSDTQGYIRVGTKSKGKYITIYAHRLQAYQKYGNESTPKALNSFSSAYFHWASRCLLSKGLVV